MRSRIPAILILAIVAFTSAAAAQHVNLYTWYSGERKDHFTTSDPNWTGVVGARKDSYTLIRIEGKIFSPDLPQPDGAVPLYNFWSGQRGDNFLTSNPEWTSQEESGVYRRSRLMGYLFATPKAGTIPLTSYWSAANADNYATSDPRPALEPSSHAGSRKANVKSDNYRSYRVEGYLIPPTSEEERASKDFTANLEKIGFGSWRPLQPQERGGRPSTPLARAEARFTTPLIIVPLEFGIARFTLDDLSRFGRLASNTNDLSLERAVLGTSRGRFAWNAKLTPVVRDRITGSPRRTGNPADEQHWALLAARDAVRTGTREAYERQQGYSIDVYDLDGDGAKADELDMWTRVLKIIDPFVRYNQYDVNGDRIVDASELVVLRFGADPGVGAQTLPESQTARLPSLVLDGVTVRSSVAVLAKDTTLAGIVHELLHVWGGIDIYGPFWGAHNQRASLMAAMETDDRMWELDPWHQQKFGWIFPRFVPIGPASRRAGGTKVMMASGYDQTGVDEARPLLFYDPARGLGEYFLVEYRTPFPTCATSSLPGGACPGYKDNGAADIGFAVWHVMTKQNGDLTYVTKANDSNGRFFWDGITDPTEATRGLGVVDPSDGKIGRPRFLKPANGEMALRWIDGTDTGLRLKAGAVSRTANSAIIQWRDAASPLAPRLDRLGVEGFPRVEYPRVRGGQLIAVDGVFHASRGTMSAALVDASGTRLAARIASWDPHRLLIELPTAVRAGRYRLVVAHSRSGGSSDSALSNGLKLEVEVPLETVATRASLTNAELARLMRSNRPELAPGLTLDLEATAADVPDLPLPDPRSAVPVGVYPAPAADAIVTPSGKKERPK